MELQISPKRYILKSRLNFGESVEDLEGIAVLQERKDWTCRCAEYVFNTLMNENWLSPTTLPPLALWYDTENFLKEKGYFPVQKPEDYDIVVYMHEKRNLFSTQKKTMHFGIYEQGKVISKFGSGSVYIHDIDMVEPGYGNKAVFFRKNA